MPGYYVNDDSDTIKGLIEYRTTAQMADYINFKANADSHLERLRPETIKLVVVDKQGFFEGLTVPVLGTDSTTFGFVRRLIYGRLSLYQLGENRYFVTKDNNELREITKFQKLRNDNKIQIIYHGLGILRVVTGDCPSYDDLELQKLFGDEKNFRVIVRNYNNCVNAKYVEYDKIKVPAHVSIGVHGSLNISQVNLSGVTFMEEADFGSRISGTGGIFLSYFHPKLGNDFRIVAEPSYGKYNGYSFYYNGGSIANDLYLRYSFVRMPVVVRYQFKGAFADLGWTNMFVLKQNNSWRKELEMGSGTVISTVNGPDYKLKNRLIGVAAGIGYRIDIADRALYTSVRYSYLFRTEKLSDDQPYTKWIDVNLAIQITK